MRAFGYLFAILGLKSAVCSLVEFPIQLPLPPIILALGGAGGKPELRNGDCLIEP